MKEFLSYYRELAGAISQSSGYWRDGQRDDWIAAFTTELEPSVAGLQRSASTVDEVGAALTHLISMAGKV